MFLFLATVDIDKNTQIHDIKCQMGWQFWSQLWRASDRWDNNQHVTCRRAEQRWRTSPQQEVDVSWCHILTRCQAPSCRLLSLLVPHVELSCETVSAGSAWHTTLHHNAPVKQDSLEFSSPLHCINICILSWQI